jgi:hypothetical protein
MADTERRDPMHRPPDDIATRIMGQMVRLPPKPHGEMKLGKAGKRIGPRAKAEEGKPE